MNILFSVLSVISVIIVISLVFLWSRYVKGLPLFGQMKGFVSLDTYPLLSVIIPACNEELSIEQTVRQLVNQDYPNLELIVVNDRSTDKTGAILQKLKVEFPKLTVITIDDLPENWLGKTNAIHQGVKNSSGEWLLFTDADVLFAPKTLKETVSYAVEHSLDHLAIAPDIFNGGILYRSFIAYVCITVTIMLMFTKKAGMGSFNLVRKSTYNEVGRYEAVAMKIIDDVSFGELIVDKGYKQQYGRSGTGLIVVNWYDTLSEIFKGFEKNQFAAMKFNVALTLSAGLFILLINVYPFVGLFLGPTWARTLCGVSILSWFTVYNNMAKDFNISRSFILFHPISALFSIGAVLNSMFKTLRQGGVEWRGKLYSIEELKKNI